MGLRPDDFIKCTLFTDISDSIVNYIKEGNIIRLHRIEVSFLFYLIFE